MRSTLLRFLRVCGIAAFVAAGTPLAAQVSTGVCSISSAPYQFEPNSRTPSKFSQGYTSSLELFGAAGLRRVVVAENYGYGVFSVNAQGKPQQADYRDMSTTIPLAGDGQSTVINVGAAGDGSRMLVGWKQTPYGTILMKPVTSLYWFAGDYSSSRPSGGLQADENGGRYYGFSLSQLGLVVADITDTPTGGETTAGSITREIVSTAPVNSYISNLTIAGHFLVYSIGTRVVVVDVRNPGAPGTNFTRSYVVKTYAPTDFGLPASHMFQNVAAAVHPNGKLYVAAQTADAWGASSGIGLAAGAGPAFDLAQAADPFTPAVTPGQPVNATQASTFAVTPQDALLLVWVSDPSTGKPKLVTLSVNGWGTDMSPDLIVDPAQAPAFWGASAVRAFEESGSVYAYVATRGGAYGLTLDCPAVPQVIRGDADGNGRVELPDVLALISYLFAGGPAPLSPTRGDANGDGAVTTADVLFLVNYLFAGGPAPN